MPLNQPWQLQFISLGPRIQPEDIDWLIEDIGSRSDDDDLRLATNGALMIWRQGGDFRAQIVRTRLAHL